MSSQASARWFLGKKSLEAQLIDARTQALGGISSWFPTNIRLMELTSRMKSVDFLRLSSNHACSYVFEGIFQGAQAVTLEALFDLFRTLKSLSSDVSEDDEDERNKMCRIKLRVAEVLSLIERDFPATFMELILHEMMHIPDAIFR